MPGTVQVECKAVKKVKNYVFIAGYFGNSPQFQFIKMAGSG